MPLAGRWEGGGAVTGGRTREHHQPPPFVVPVIFLSFPSFFLVFTPQCFCPGILHSLAARVPARILVADEGADGHAGQKEAEGGINPDFGTYERPSAIVDGARAPSAAFPPRELRGPGL